ncbi:MAG: ExbD/TolR family protein [Myxococcota bacterium]
MSLRESRKRRSGETTLEMTPLIDVVFLLLIFFLITTTFSQKREAEIPIDLPEAATGEQGTEGDKIVLFVTEDGQVEVRGEERVQGATLDEKLDWLYQNKPDSVVVLRGDENAAHGRVVQLLSKIREVGFPKVNVVISEPSE